MRCYVEVRHCGRGSFPASRDHESWCDPTVAAFCEERQDRQGCSFKTRLLDEGWEPDFNHVAFAPFATACFRSICTRYLEQTSSSHLIGKLKSFVMARMSFGKHVNNPLNWTSTVESSWNELQGATKRFDPEALGIQPALRGSFAG